MPGRVLEAQERLQRAVARLDFHLALCQRFLANADADGKPAKARLGFPRRRVTRGERPDALGRSPTRVPIAADGSITVDSAHPLLGCGHVAQAELCIVRT